MSKKTTCPLDCYDGCSVVVDKNLVLKGEKEHPVTKGHLCANLNHFFDFTRISTPLFEQKQIELDAALEILRDKLTESKPAKVLYLQGSGNLGKMQNITKLFFSQFGATIAQGSLCDEAGGYGIEEGRGANLALSPTQVAKCEVVILWGRNVAVTNPHMLHAIKGKTLIVIDPLKIDLALKADLYVSIKPRGDIYLAMLLARFAYTQQMDDEEFIQNRCKNFDYYLDMISAYFIRDLSQKSGVCLSDADKILSMIAGKKVAILVGTGVQKYTHGHSVLRAIDSFAALLGLFGKEGCGVGYPSNSFYGFENPFFFRAKTTPLPLVDFGAYDLVFIQGGNPANQMPCTPKIKEALKKAKFVVYMGLHVNETSNLAQLVIPAKSFLEKEDVKLSYGHEFVGLMPKITEAKFGISEYELTQFLLKNFGFAPALREQEYIEKIIASGAVQKDGHLISKVYDEIAYASKFYTADEKFLFFDEFYDEKDGKEEEGFYLLSGKYNKSLNSQFQTHDALHVPPCLGLADDSIVQLSRGEFTCRYVVKNDARLRNDCVLLYSGARDANMLTPTRMSQEGEMAVFQEEKVKLKVIDE
ncbi:MAG: molybdopterin-dependent oxidoreductase [Sulfurospirillum sp.]|nr:molybdopterin-dependent oxidoreductase [Sulfurospirillum sp.]